MWCLLWVVVYPGEHQHLPLPSNHQDRHGTIRGSSNLSWSIPRPSGRGAEDLAGNPLASKFIWIFKTGVLTLSLCVGAPALALALIHLSS